MLVGMHGVGLHEWWPVAGPLLAVWILFKLAFWAALIAGVVLGIRWLRRGGRERWRQTPLDALRLRYARGDINREEFEAMKRDLAGS
jgi:putative membrane protein